jgi:hypothetical protein
METVITQLPNVLAMQAGLDWIAAHLLSNHAPILVPITDNAIKSLLSANVTQDSKV